MQDQVQADMPRRESVDPVDLARYERLGAEWWDPKGPMGKLHEINPLRLGYLREMIETHRPRVETSPDEGPFHGLSMLDIGCGGGVLSEPLCRLGGTVTGIDPGRENIAAARHHAETFDLPIDYRATTAEALAASGERFDVVLAMEVVEHVVDRNAFMATVCSLVKPGGLLIASTLNRTAKSFLLAIVGAEYVLRWLPRGTHNWNQFVTPEELVMPIRRAGLKVLNRTGMTYDPLHNTWSLGRDTDVNYFVTAQRKATREDPARMGENPRKAAAG
ncbi:bifunctional 2-polyprenyl-6-hydroxyphenol methylase/3-demethylubiquinol 3-O-methyltransferase UbiG [Lichenihabitans sp. PAMC28606]|nr:bifunctional 2-polyprenyl-6-hydroxyphenol methylase/3-demethylubiquinol 3-O-methyltransferase UbiG [Lichenihabitans sp. PAMC28606]UDL96804.1 bifunctional 2-polyprenyl-6-hydroxyphenol methylase/3-demethylubiquinol 3-O-methyltransferase UbiG [Lichenihabitans sp. PAMC28606]